jgi:CheY-like chemotaxis protein
MKKKLNCVLLIDDDEPTNFLHAYALEKADVTERIVTAKSGQEALDFLTSVMENGEHPQPDVIFLDINMPGMDGWEFLGLYNELNLSQQGKIVLVMLTTSLNPSDEDRAEQVPGISSFQNKPLTIDKINGMIQKYFPEQV